MTGLDIDAVVESAFSGPKLAPADHDYFRRQLMYALGGKPSYDRSVGSKMGHAAVKFSDTWLNGWSNLIQTAVDWGTRPVSQQIEPTFGAKAADDDIDIPDWMEIVHGREKASEIRHTTSRALGNYEMLPAMAAEVFSWVAGAPRAGIGAANALARHSAGALAKGGKLGDGIDAARAMQLMKEGRLAQTIAKDRGWSKLAERTAKMIETTPNAAGMALGAALTAENGDRGAAGLHGLAAYYPFHILGKLGQGAERWITSKLLTESQRKALNQLRGGTREAPVAIGSAGKLLRQLPGRTAGAILEGTGFMALPVTYSTILGFGDDTILDLINKAKGGDTDALEQLTAQFLGSVAGVLGVKHALPSNQWLYYKRQNPDLNDLQLRADVQHMKRGVVLENIPQEIVDNTRGLFRAGWEVRGEISDAESVKPGVELEFPGSGTVRISDGEIVVAKDVYEAVTGKELKGTDKFTATGEAKDSFLNDLTLHSLQRRAEAELWMSKNGFGERAAGDVWLDMDAQNVLTTNLRGDLLSRDAYDHKGEWTVTKDGMLDRLAEVGVDPDAPPVIEQWSIQLNDLAQRQPMPKADEAIGAALLLAQRGKADTPSVVELRRFLSEVDPAMLLYEVPRELLALELGSLASGTQNAQNAFQSLGVAEMAGQVAERQEAGRLGVGEEREFRGRRRPQEPEEVVEEADPAQLGAGEGGRFRGSRKPSVAEYLSSKEEAGQADLGVGEGGRFAGRRKPQITETQQGREKLQEIAGREDWRSIRGEPGGRQKIRESALEYARESLKIGEEPTPTKMRELFGISRDTARSYLEKVRKEGRAEAEGPEAGAILSLDVEALGRRLGGPVEGTIDLARKWYERLTDRIERVGGERGKELKQRALRVVDALERNLGRLYETSRRGAKLTASLKPRYRQAVEDLMSEREVEIDGVKARFSRFQDLVEGREIEGKVTPEQREIADAYRDLFQETGKLMEEAGAVMKGREEYIPFKTAADRQRFVRAAGQDLDTVLNTPELRGKLAKVLSELNKVPLEAVEKSLVELARDPSAGLTDVSGGGPRTTAAEFARIWKQFPTSVEIEGKSYQLIETEPHQAMRRMEHSTAARAAVVEEFGPDVPKEIRKQMGIEKGGIESAFREFLRETGGGAETVAAAKDLFKAVQDLSLDRLTKGERAFSSLDRNVRSMMLSLSFIVNLPEPIATTWQYTGLKNLGKAALSLTRDGLLHPMETYREMVRQGKIMRDEGIYNLTEGRGFGKLFRVATSGLMHLTQKGAEMLAVRSAEYMVKDMQAGRGTRIDAWRLQNRLDFTEAEVEAMMSGRAPQSLYDSVTRRARGYASASLQPAVRSKAGASQRWNTWIAFDRFFQNRFAQLAQVNQNMYRALKSGNLTDIRLAGQDMGVFMLGSLVSGYAQVLMAYTLSNGFNPGEAYQQLMREFSDDFFLTSGEVGLSSIAGGVAGNIGRVVLGHPTQTLPEQAARWTRPTAVAAEIYNMAKGMGPYRDQNAGEFVGTMVERHFPLYRRAMDLAMARMAGGHQDTRNAITQYWRWLRDNDKMPAITRIGGATEENDAKFLRSMRKAVDLIRERGMKPEDSAVEEYIREALQIRTGESVAQSLLGRRMMTRLDVKDREAMERVIGKQNMRRLYQHDVDLYELSRAYRKEPGTPEAVEGSFSERVNSSAHQANLGATDAWDDLIDQVVESSINRMNAGLDVPEEDIMRLAGAMSVNLESLKPKHLPDWHYEHLRGLGAPDVANELRGWIWTKIANRARSRARR